MILRPGEKAIAIVLPEARAIALVEAARAAGRLAGPETVRLEGFVMVAEAAFERLSNGFRTGFGSPVRQPGRTGPEPDGAAGECGGEEGA